MAKSFLLACKWIYLLLQIKYNEKWLYNTYDGGLYLKKKLLNLGVIGIKFGQYLYVLKRGFSPIVNKIMEPLVRSDNIIHSYDETIKMLSHDANYNNLNIQEIGEIIGSGSVAQVHKCILKDNPNKKFVIKVAHPCIINLANELNTLQRCFAMFKHIKNYFIDWNHFFDDLRFQIDLNNEANNIKTFYNIYKDYDKIEIPELIYSHKYFIIMSYCEGKHIQLFNKNSDEYITAINLITSSLIHTIYKYKLHHGDLHLGNILVKSNGNIALLDFGICCKIESTTKYNELLYLYRKVIYLSDYNSLLVLFKYLISNKNENINYDNLVLEFISKYKNLNKRLLRKIIKFLSEKKIILTSYLIHWCLQNFFLMTVMGGHKHNDFYFNTLSYMKTDSFFMNEMSEYILKLHELEFTNRNLPRGD